MLRYKLTFSFVRKRGVMALIQYRNGLSISSYSEQAAQNYRAKGPNKRIIIHLVKSFFNGSLLLNHEHNYQHGVCLLLDRHLKTVAVLRLIQRKCQVLSFRHYSHAAQDYTIHD